MNAIFLEAIGSITIEFALLERELDSAISLALVGNDLRQQPIAQIVCAELSFKASVHLLQSLLRFRLRNVDETRLKEVSAKLFAAEVKRNVVVHSTWAEAEEGTVLRMKTTAKGHLKHQFEHLTLDDLRATAKELHAAAEDLMNFSLRALGVIPLESPTLSL